MVPNPFDMLNFSFMTKEQYQLWCCHVFYNPIVIENTIFYVDYVAMISTSEAELKSLTLKAGKSI